METDEDLLQRLAAGGAIDYSAWPRLLCNVVSRLETIAHNDFPIPKIPPPKPLRLSPLSPARPRGPGSGSGAAPAANGSRTAPALSDNKENTIPTPSQALTNGRTAGSPTSPTAPAVSSSPPSSSHTEAGGPLPVQIADLLGNIITTLTTAFAQYPPHTIQRLSELILTPRRHYRNLASYLHAVDRVTCVTSGSNAYPLPPAVADMSALSLLAHGVAPSATSAAATTINGSSSSPSAASSAYTSPNVGSDEALGGALLTPIPWLRPRPTSSGDEHTDGSSPPSSSDSGDIVIGGGDGGGGSDGGSSSGSSSSSNSNGNGNGNGNGGLLLNTLVSQSTSPLQPQSQSQSQQQSPQPQAPQPRSPQQDQQGQRSQQGGHKSQARRIEGHVRTESTETIDGPNGVGSIETVSVSVNGIPSHGAMTAAVQLQQQRGITQGELLRQEQKAGVVPVSQLARAAAAAAAAGGNGGVVVSSGCGGGGNGSGFGSCYRSRAGVSEGDEMLDDEDEDEETSQMAESEASSEAVTAVTAVTAAAEAQVSTESGRGGNEEEEEVPHARGPEEIGAADTGPQPDRRDGGSHPRGFDLEAAVGRKAVPLPGAAPAVPRRQAAAEADDDDAGAAAAGAKTLAGQQSRAARASTPKREAEEEAPGSALPAKRLKDCRGDEAASEAASETEAAGPGSELAEEAQEAPEHVMADEEGPAADSEEEKTPDAAMATINQRQSAPGLASPDGH